MAEIRQSMTFAALSTLIGRPPSASEWVTMGQDRIDGFAQHSGDDAFIHTDPERARGTRFGGAIAHGLLSLSLLPLFARSAIPSVSDARMSVNYGFDSVRFLTPVPAGRRVRGLFTLVAASEDKPGFGKVVHDVVVELEGTGRPALTARWIVGHWLRRTDR